MASEERTAIPPSPEAIAHVLSNARFWAPADMLLNRSTRLADIAATLVECWEVLLIGSGLDEFCDYTVDYTPTTLEDVARAYDLWAAASAAAEAQESAASAATPLSAGFLEELHALERARARIVGAEHAVWDRASPSVAVFWRNPAGDVAFVLNTIGGHHAAATLAMRIRDAMHDPPAPSSIERARWPIARAQEIALAAAEPAFIAYGSMVCVVTRGDEAAIAHVGNARALWLRGERAEWMTRDHVYGVEPYAARLTRALGQRESFEIDACVIVREAGDALLLCSHDVCRAYSAEALARWVATHGREAPRLIVGALAEKAPDVISAVALVT